MKNTTATIARSAKKKQASANKAPGKKQRPGLSTYAGGPVPFNNKYIFALKDFNDATAAQQKFYRYFKAAFLKGEYPELGDNNNYAFVLMHSLLVNADYDDLNKLEKQFEQLGTHYPAVKLQAISLLMMKMRKGGRKEGVERLINQQTDYYKIHRDDAAKSHDPYYWQLGSRYKFLLKLTEEQVDLLDDIFFTCNPFNDIEFCFIEIIKLFLSLVTKLRKKIIQEGSTLKKQFTDLSKSIVADDERKRKRDMPFKKTPRFSFTETTELCSMEFYNLLFRHCENAVREHYGCSTMDIYPLFSIDAARAAFDRKIVAKALPILRQLSTQIEMPGREIETELNVMFAFRWKRRFETITKNYTEEDKRLIENILTLADLNRKNPFVKYLYYEAARFVADIDAEKALSFYVYYTWYDNQSAESKGKPLAQTILRSLLPKNEQMLQFAGIISELTKDKQLEKALNAIPGLMAKSPLTKPVGKNIPVRAKPSPLRQELLKSFAGGNLPVGADALPTNRVNSMPAGSGKNDNETINKPALLTYKNGVPAWQHAYITYYDELRRATDEQLAFYETFKAAFLRQQYYDLEGNDNYAFILLYDFRQSFSYRQMHEFEEVVQELAHYYPGVTKHALSFLMYRMRKTHQWKELKNVRNQLADFYKIDDPETTRHNTDFWYLGTRYKTELGLTGTQVNALNNVLYTCNYFNDIPYCCTQIVKLFAETVELLDNKYREKGTMFEQEFHDLAEIINRKQNKGYKPGSQFDKDFLQSYHLELYTLVFQHCENAVRRQYGYKGYVDTYPTFSSTASSGVYEKRLLNKLTTALNQLEVHIARPSREAEIELSAQDSIRWKWAFKETTKTYKTGPALFIKNIFELAAVNYKNPYVKNIFAETAVFMAAKDAEAAVSFYLYYRMYDSISIATEHKTLAEIAGKGLLPEMANPGYFEAVVTALTRDRDLEKAMKAVHGIFATQRKKITLDSEVIEAVRQQHSGTVRLLNQYLEKEDENEGSPVISRPVKPFRKKIRLDTAAIEEVQLQHSDTLDLLNEYMREEEDSTIVPPSAGKVAQESLVEKRLYHTSIGFTLLQQKLLALFSKSEFTLHKKDLEQFSRAKSVFSGQLIESINDACYDLLDDVLIEEEGHSYNVNFEYYKRILQA